MRRVQIDRTLESGVVVRAYSIIGTPRVIVEAFEPMANLRSHHRLTHIGDRMFGAIVTRSLPAEIEALPSRSHERYEAATAFRRALNREAVAAIFEAFPEFVGAGVPDRIEDGEVEFFDGRFPVTADEVAALAEDLRSTIARS